MTTTEGYGYLPNAPAPLATAMRMSRSTRSANPACARRSRRRTSTAGAPVRSTRSRRSSTRSVESGGAATAAGQSASPARAGTATSQRMSSAAGSRIAERMTYSTALIRMFSRRDFMRGVFAGAAVIANRRTAAAGDETLYNGIRLPQPWPPRLASLPRTPITPAYLTDPPSVIPIDVGRQLFVDDFLIEETTLERTYHRASYYPSN